ncbi:MAG: restriction endonuclease subunit S [Cyanobacteria bacterium P01_F01_bin.116]
MSENGQKLSELPQGWVQCSGDLIFNFVTSGSRGWAKYYADSGAAFLRMGNLNHASITLDLQNLQRVQLPSSVEGTRSLVQGRDLLISITADVGMIALVPDNFEEAYINQHVALARPSTAISSAYIAWFLASQEGGQKQFKELQRGATKTGLGLDDIRAVQIPLPPLAEQHRIVNKIEELFTQLDAGVDLLKKLKLKLKRYRQAVLKVAVEGKLTQDWRAAHQDELEPASVLLDRILKERREKWEADQLAKMEAKGKVPKNDKWKLKYKEPPAPDAKELPELPEIWKWVSLGQLTWFVKDGPHYSPKYATDGIPFITGGNVKPSGVDFVNAKKITKELHKELSQRCKPELGDILYTKGGTTGVARVNTYDFEFNVWVHVAVLKLAGPTAPFYVQHALNSPSCYAQSQRFTHGVGNQDLGLTRMVNIVLGLPPIDEQEIIITEIDRKMSLLDELDKAIKKNLNRAEKLRQSILQKAFEGKLVSQEPNDEPASLLLERIQTEKAQQEAKSKKRKTATKKSQKTNKPKRLKSTDGSNEEQVS